MRKKKWTALALVTAMILSLSSCGIVKVEKGATETDAEASPADGILSNGESHTEDKNKKKVDQTGDSVDFDIRPQDDFYGYVNADDLWEMEIEYGNDSAGTFTACSDAVMDEQVELLKGIISSTEEYELGSPEQLVRDYYLQQMEPKKDYTAEFDKVFAMIDGANTPDDIANVSVTLFREYGVTPIFAAQLDRNIFKPDEYAISFPYLQTPVNLKEIKKTDTRIEYRDQMRDYLTGFGISFEEAEERANDIMYFMFDIANNTDFDAIMSDDPMALVNIYSESEFEKLLSNIDVKRLLKTFGVENNPYGEYNVYMVGQMEVINDYLTEEHMQMWKDYSKILFVMNYEAFAPASYLYYVPDENNIPEDQVMENVVVDMQEQMGELYYNTYYTEEYAEAMAKLEADIKVAYVDMINNADWLTKEGRAAMVEKFNNIEFYFGGQESYEHSEADAKLIGKNAFETKVNFAKNRYDSELVKVGTVPDNSKWEMTSPIINAYYQPSANSIYITRGIMHAPFFELDREYGSNLGGLGSVIGHELSHAFDSNGIMYDANGAYNPDWISKEDQEAFVAKQQQVIDLYNNQTMLDVYHVDGEKTLGENLADIGGVQCMLTIAKTDEDKKHLFEAYAKVWCALYPDQTIIYALTQDVHSPDLIRVNTVIMNFDEFYRLYDVKEEDGMYLAPEDRVVRW